MTYTQQKRTSASKKPTSTAVSAEPIDRDMATLKRHPKQSEFFEDLSNEELKALADDIQRNGLQHPIVVLPDGTILEGHQRVKACQLLGRTVIKAIVRQDLAQDQVTSEMLFIESNLNRRHQSVLPRMRAYLRQLELEEQKTGQKIRGKAGIIARRFNFGSKESNNRYCRVLEAPRVIQDAFESGQLTLLQAAQFSTFKTSVKGDILKAISEGTSPREAYQAQFPAPKPTCRQALDYFVKSANRVLFELKPFVDTTGDLTNEELNAAINLRNLCEKLIEQNTIAILAGIGSEEDEESLESLDEGESADEAIAC